MPNHVGKLVIRCMKKHVPRFLILESLSTEINDEESCVEKDIGILNTRAKQYENNLNQVMSTPIPESKKKPREDFIYEVQ